MRDIKTYLEDFCAERKIEAAPPPLYLDVGCSEGSITSAVARAISARPENAFGVDVVDVKPDAGFTFKKTDGKKLDFPDATFDLETAFMSMHHFEFAAAMFAEMRRVAKPGAWLIVREHDANPAYLALAFDTIHALYSVVFNAEETPEGFAAKLATGTYSYYRPCAEWTRQLEKAGWQLASTFTVDCPLRSGACPKTSRADFVNGYYALYKAAPAPSI